MIQATGTIQLSNGFHIDNPLINVYVENSQKYRRIAGIAQYCKEKIEVVVIEPSTEDSDAITEDRPYLEIFQPNIALYEGIIKNPTFEMVQSMVLAGLQADFPAVQFAII